MPSRFFLGEQILLAGTYDHHGSLSTYPSHAMTFQTPIDENPRDTDMLRALLTASFSDRLLTSSRKHSEVGAGEGFWEVAEVVTLFQKVFGGSFEGFFQGVSCYKYITGWWFQTFFLTYLGNKSPFFFNIFQMGGINPPTRKRYLPQEETWWLFCSRVQFLVYEK